MDDDAVLQDFRRKTWCLLGLPFDAVDLQAAVESIRRAAGSGRTCFFSTPNLNFAVSALGDASFRQTLLNSDLSLLDGMPLLWAARILGIRLPEKVSGSDLFAALWQRPASENSSLKVFFFGGADGIAESASRNIAAGGAGLQCAGFLNPGFGSIDELSNPEFLDRINRSDADFLVVALGARKGQMWIDRNRVNLNPPVVGHLGAVLNFVAGTVRRAPAWMQRAGLEWTWRIYEEPSLWRRYLFDGVRFAAIFLTRLLPYALWRRFNPDRQRRADSLVVNREIEGDRLTISIEGACLRDSIEPLRPLFTQAALETRDVRLDLAGVSVVDGAFLGLCLVLKKHLDRSERRLEFVNPKPAVARIFRWSCVEYLL